MAKKQHPIGYAKGTTGKAIMIRHHGNTERRRRIVIPMVGHPPGYSRTS